MTYDAKVPSLLKETQQWFASIITQPIDMNSKINPITPSGQPIEEDAKRFIEPSPTLKPFERIQIYNQQYWWRLLGALHETFPLVVRLFGYRDFNEIIATPYLVKYPSDHWSLNRIGNRLPQWLEEEYHKNDKQLVLDAVKIDLAYEDAFYTADHSSIGEQTSGEVDPMTFLSKKLYHQPHLYLFSIRYDLFSFRESFLKEEPEYWEEHPFPELNKERQYHFVLYRNARNNIEWKELEVVEYLLLQNFREGKSIEETIQWLEKQPDQHRKQAEEKLHQWIQQWVARRWLATTGGE